jgi:hypothetical protein
MLILLVIAPNWANAFGLETAASYLHPDWVWQKSSQFHLGTIGHNMIGDVPADKIRFWNLKAIAIASDGTLAVADSSHKRIVVIKTNGSVSTIESSYWDLLGKKYDPLSTVIGLAFTSEGNIIAGTLLDGIYFYSPELKLLSRIEQPTNHHRRHFSDIAVSNGKIFALECEERAVHTYTENGTALGSFSYDHGDHHSCFDGADKFSIGPSGMLAIAHNDTKHVKLFSQEGAFLGSFNNEYPEAVAFNPDDNLWVINNGHAALKLHQLDGTLLREFPVSHFGRNFQPQQVAFAPNGLMAIIADDKIELFDLSVQQ